MKKAEDALMKVLRGGKDTDLILEKLDQLQKEQKEIHLQIDTERTEILDYTLPEIASTSKGSSALTVQSLKTAKP